MAFSSSEPFLLFDPCILQDLVNGQTMEYRFGAKKFLFYSSVSLEEQKQKFRKLWQEKDIKKRETLIWFLKR